MHKSGPADTLRWAVVALALAGITALSPTALAQSGPTQSIASDDLFWPYDTTSSGPSAADFKPGGVDRLLNVVRQVQTPGSSCPIDVEFTVVDSLPDPVLSQSLAAARRDAIKGVLDGFNPAVRITAKSTTGLVSMVLMTVQSAKDKEPPKLHTVSAPRKGTRVKAGDEITVTMVARDDANLWQSGIKTIQLVADSEAGRFVASQNYLPLPQVCAEPSRPLKKTVEATYTVPSDPPPIVRLAALAEDHVGLMDTDVGEFPTREMWKGTVKLERDGANTCSAIESETEFTIAVAGDGEVSGSGTLHHSSWTCEGGYTAPATRGTIKLGGKKRDGVFTIFLNDWNPKNAHMPRIPGGHWVVQVGQGSTGEGTFTFGMPDVVFRVKLECQTCSQAAR